MHIRRSQQAILTSAALLALIVAAAALQGTRARTATAKMPMPGDPLPAVNYSGMFATPEPVRRVAEAIATPFEAAAERLRPMAARLFPALWDTPQPAPVREAYTVRDKALRVVHDSI